MYSGIKTPSSLAIDASPAMPIKRRGQESKPDETLVRSQD
jgi:hypothetical protein